MKPRCGEHHNVVENGRKGRDDEPKCTDVPVSAGTYDEEDCKCGRTKIHYKIKSNDENKEYNKVSHRKQYYQHKLQHQCKNRAYQLKKPKHNGEKEEYPLHRCGKPLARGTYDAPTVKSGIGFEYEVLCQCVQKVDHARGHQHQHNDNNYHRHVFKR